MGEAWNRCAPQNVLAGFWIPMVRKILTVSNARRFWTTKRRPVCLGRTLHCFRWGLCPRSAFDVAGWNRLRFGCRRPGAAADDHPTNLAVVRDEIETDVSSLFPDSVFSGDVTARSRYRNGQLDLATSALPVSS